MNEEWKKAFKSNDLKWRTKQFALRIIRMYGELPATPGVKPLDKAKP